MEKETAVDETNDVGITRRIDTLGRIVIPKEIRTQFNWHDGEEITLLLGLTGMATLLAATTHAPIMSTLMICEMTGEYQLLPGLLIACVIASVISRTLHRDSIYRQHTAKHS